MHVGMAAIFQNPGQPITDREVYALPPDVFSDEDARPKLTAVASRPHDARVFAALRDDGYFWFLPTAGRCYCGCDRRVPMPLPNEKEE